MILSGVITFFEGIYKVILLVIALTIIIESRVVMFFRRSLAFILAIVIIFPSNFAIEIVLILVLLLDSIIASLRTIVFIGEHMKIKDSDYIGPIHSGINSLFTYLKIDTSDDLMSTTSNPIPQEIELQSRNN